LDFGFGSCHLRLLVLVTGWRHRVNTIQRFIAAVRRSHPPQGLIPIAYVAR